VSLLESIRVLPLDPETWFHERASHYVEAQVLYHLNACGVFSALAEGCATTGALAERLDLTEVVLETLLCFVEGVDMLLVRGPSGEWGLTEFGRSVLDRYGRMDAEGLHLNLFDVRVGAYGPVWEACGALLRGERTYGADLARKGDAAAEGVYKVGARMGPALARWMESQQLDGVVEWGVTTGLLAGLPVPARVGVDRNAGALQAAASRAVADGQADIDWVEADLFSPSSWIGRTPAGRSAHFSVHFHELLAHGEEAVITLLQTLGEAQPGNLVVALEQPRLDLSARDTTPRSEWLYACSNVLIHHLIGNGRILDRAEWTDLFRRGGCTPVRGESMGYLGYELFAFSLGADR
jgi:hypothetical protein